MGTAQVESTYWKSSETATTQRAPATRDAECLTHFVFQTGGMELRDAAFSAGAVRAAFTSEIPPTSRIESTPGVCGGNPCVVRTRIPVWALEGWRRQGLSDAQILKMYPTLRAPDLQDAWQYVRLHGEEIEKQIAMNENA